jgi:hypothetical protein
MARETNLVIVRRGLHHVNLGCSRNRIRQRVAVDELPAVDQYHNVAKQAARFIQELLTHVGVAR